MGYRRICRWAQWGLMAAMVGLHGAVFFWREDPPKPNFVLTAAHDAQLLSAIVLIVGWAVLGPARWWVRLAAAPVLIGLWFLPWNGAMQPREVTVQFIGTFFCASGIVIGGLRALGLRVVERSATASPERGAQFSLLSLILAMTSIAAAIGALEVLRPVLSAGNEFHSRLDAVLSAATATRIPMDAARWTRGVVMAMAAALAASGGLWVVLGSGSPWLRLAGLGALIPAAGVYLSHVAGNPNTDLIPTAMSLSSGLAAVAGLVGISVLPLRVMGFRLAQEAGDATGKAAGWPSLNLSAEKVTAVLLVGAAIAAIWLRGPTPAERRQAVIGRVNINSLYFVRGSASGDYSIRPPLATFARWIEHRNVWNFDESITVYFRGAKLRTTSLLLLQAKVNTVEISNTPETMDSFPDFAVTPIENEPVGESLAK